MVQLNISVFLIDTVFTYQNTHVTGLSVSSLGPGLGAFFWINQLIIAIAPLLLCFCLKKMAMIYQYELIYTQLSTDYWVHHRVAL
jgi:hypothetical protein